MARTLTIETTVFDTTIFEAQNEKTVETQYRVCNSFNSIIELDTFEIQEGGSSFQKFFALRMSNGRPVL